MPSVEVPWRSSISSDKTVCIQGNLRPGNLSFCKDMTSEREVPKFEVLKMVF